MLNKSLSFIPSLLFLLHGLQLFSTQKFVIAFPADVLKKTKFEDFPITSGDATYELLKLKKNIDLSQEILNKHNSKQTQDCLTDITAIYMGFLNYENSSICDMGYYFQNVTQISDYFTGLDGFCSACNFMDYLTLLNDARCTGDEESLVWLRMIINTYQLYCFKSTGGEYCFFNQMVFAQPSTQRDYSDLCSSECGMELPEFAMDVVPCHPNAMSLAYTCVQDTETERYCSADIRSLEENYGQRVFPEEDPDPEDDPIEPLTDQDIEFWEMDLEDFCMSNCSSAISQRVEQHIASREQQCLRSISERRVDYIGVLCDVDDTGSLCVPKVARLNETILDIGFANCPEIFPSDSDDVEPPSKWQSCPASCRADMKLYVEEYGCCTSAFSETVFGRNESQIMDDWIMDECRNDLPPICETLLEYQNTGLSGSYRNIPQIGLAFYMCIFSVLYYFF